MIAKPDSLESHSRDPLPNSRKVHLQGSLFSDLRVPMREIRLSATRTIDARLELNEPVRVYDTSGPWGDPDFDGTAETGLPPLREPWILTRGDVEAYGGRRVTARDAGFGPPKIAQSKNGQDGGHGDPGVTGGPGSFRRPVRALPGRVVTQLAYARAGIVTREMEFVAIRENQGLEFLRSVHAERRND